MITTQDRFAIANIHSAIRLCKNMLDRDYTHYLFNGYFIHEEGYILMWKTYWETQLQLIKLKNLFNKGK